MIFDYPHYDSTGELRPATEWWWAQGATVDNWIAIDAENTDAEEWFGELERRTMPIALWPSSGLVIWAGPHAPRRAVASSTDPRDEFASYVAELPHSSDPSGRLLGDPREVLDDIIAEARRTLGLTERLDTYRLLPHFGRPASHLLRFFGKFPEGREHARTCDHGNEVWLGNECGHCEQRGVYLWKD